jgi:universal stress protein E
VDWELVRTCPGPLLIVKPRAGRQRGPVLAAIDPNHAAAKPAALDRQILRAAHDISLRLKRPLRAVHAWQPLTYLYASAPTETAPVWIPPESDAQYEQTLRRLGDAELRHADLASGQVEFIIGTPEEVLPELARQSHAELIVMGAISRTGLERLMLGSTAQRVMDRVPCDVLVIKPRGFRSPISRAARLAPPIVVPVP